MSRKSLFSIIIFLTLITTNANAEMLTKDVSAKPWNYRIIYNDAEINNSSKGIIVYLHGDGHNGQVLGDMRSLASGDGPAMYAEKYANWLPEGYIFICPQGHENADFRNHPKELISYIHQFKEIADDYGIKFLCAGQSNGAIALYKVACMEPELADGWIFVSGKRPTEFHEKLSCQNSFVVYGSKEPMYNDRYDFENVFPEIKIISGSTIDSETGNAYFVSDNWSHGQTPRIFLEDFLWEWIDLI